MSRAFILCLAIVACVDTASAQEMDMDLYDGKWTAQIEGVAGVQSARLTVANFGGTWQDVPGRSVATNAACRGKKFPITVQRSVSTEMEFMVWGSNISPACPDLRVVLKPVDARTMEGSIAAGGTMKMTRSK